MKPTVSRHGTDKSRQDARDAAGIAGAARIMTLDGERPVATLRPGERIVTRDSGTAVLRAVHRRPLRAQAVHVPAGALGHDRPTRDTRLPAGQPVLVRDWRAQALFGTPQALVPVGRLVDGAFVTLQEDVAMAVYELEFDSPHVLYIDGLELASHLGAEAPT